MLSYLVLFCLIIVLSFLEATTPKFKANNYYALIGIGVLLVLFAGLRTVGFDYDEYASFYKLIRWKTQDSFLVEPGFSFLIILANFLHAGFHLFLFLLCGVSLVLTFLFFKKISFYPLFSLVIFFPITFIMQDMGQIRFGLALSIVMYAYTFLLEGKKYPFLALSLLAMCFHNSAIIVIPIAFIISIEWKKSIIIGLFVFSFLFMSLDIRNYLGYLIDFLPSNFQSKIIFYSSSEEYGTSLGLSITFYFRIVILLALYFCRDLGLKTVPYYMTILKLYFVGVVVYMLFNSIGEFGIRFSDYFKVLEYIIFPLFIEMAYSKKMKLGIFFIAVLYGGWSLYKLFSDPTLSIYLDPYHSIFF